MPSPSFPFRAGQIKQNGYLEVEDEWGAWQLSISRIYTCTKSQYPFALFI